MPTLGLNHINLRVPASELATLRDFYVDIVGLVVGHRPPFTSVGTWLYAGDSPILHLSQRHADETAAPEARPALVRDRRSALDHIALSCTQPDEYIARLERHGVSYTRTEVPLTRSVQLCFRDPSGVAVELIFAAQHTDAPPDIPPAIA